MSIENALLNKLLGVKEDGEIPVILVKRHLPHPLTTKMHETGWIGLRKVFRRGKPAFEKDHNFKLSIDVNGVAEVPDCEENRVRLERLCKPRTTKVVVREKNARGILVKKKDGKGNTVYRNEEKPPLYERLDVAVLSDQLMDSIIDRMEKRAKKRATEEEDLDGGDDDIVDQKRARPGRRKAVDQE